MRNAKGKVVQKTIMQENLEMMQELERTQESIEKQEALCVALEKENQKLKMLQNFSSVFNKTQSSKDSMLVTNIVKELRNIREFLDNEVQEIQKLKKEKQGLINKVALLDQELSVLRPGQSEVTRKIARERSYNEINFKFP